MALGWRGSYLRYREFFLNIMSLYKKRTDLRAFLEIILSLGTIIVFLVFALKPTALTIISLLQEIKEKQATLAGLDLKIRNLSTANNVLNQNQSSIPNVDLSVGNAPQPDVIAKQVEGVAAKNSVNILGISIGQVTIVGTTPAKKASSSDVKPISPKAKEMSISISVRGGYSNLREFVKDMESLRIATNIDSVGITASETDAGQVIVAVVSGRLPFLGQE